MFSEDSLVEEATKKDCKNRSLCKNLEAQCFEKQGKLKITANHRNVKVGKQTLNGAQALGYCRIRKKGTTVNGLRDDYGRTWRQRTVIKAVFDKVKTFPMTEWLGIANKLLGNIKTDLTNEKIISYVTDGLRLGTTEIHQLQVPLEGYYRSSSPGEFSVGDCLVMTDGINSSLSATANAEALNNFIFKYNGKQPFSYGNFTSKSD